MERGDARVGIEHSAARQEDRLGAGRDSERREASRRFALVGSQPARDVVRFRFELPASGEVALEVFDVSGRRVADRIVGSWPAGSHEIAWDARRLAQGVYVARLTALSQQEVAPLILVR